MTGWQALMSVWADQQWSGKSICFVCADNLGRCSWSAVCLIACFTVQESVEF
jgi:hypothetical protein